MSKKERKHYKQMWIEATTEMLMDTESLTRRYALNKAKALWDCILK